MDGLDPMEVQPNHDTSSSGSEEEGDSEDVEDKRSNSDSLDSDEDWQAVLLASVQTGESAGCSAGRDEGRSQGRERVESGNQEGESSDTSILVSDTPKTLRNSACIMCFTSKWQELWSLLVCAQIFIAYM